MFNRRFGSAAGTEACRYNPILATFQYIRTSILVGVWWDLNGVATSISNFVLIGVQ
jgi:hypothetical protein